MTEKVNRWLEPLPLSKRPCGSWTWAEEQRPDTDQSCGGGKAGGRADCSHTPQTEKPKHWSPGIKRTQEGIHSSIHIRREQALEQFNKDASKDPLAKIHNYLHQ